ncbi:hypothetical protein K469DRAFT_733285 [Zopfia rhizophila CBS 207.26]|uniref:NAD(P)-binding protein n=1 Tax=Zopfia rhizophila CBS 207.26 TaxID=1314779 RepID=A0A6A6EKB8_9PEZI|nr:hypothetical protein K469DRAFT_733285 [Zopfia rhizophila CBS 207.26]
MPPWSPISPAPRGIGFALAQRVDGLEIDEKRLPVLKIDVLDDAIGADAVAICKDRFPPSNFHHLHLAFIVPGILFAERSPTQINADDELLTFRTNTISPMLPLKYFAHLLPSKRKAPTFDEGEGALEGLPSVSTAAIMCNQCFKTFDNHLRTTSGDNVVAVALHPGTVKTSLREEFWGSVKKGKLFESDWVAERLML